MALQRFHRTASFDATPLRATASRSSALAAHTLLHTLTQPYVLSQPLPQDGQFRWNRLENLLREGSKSADFDPSQLWLLAEWLLSPGAAGVRSTIVAELGRVIDAAAAADVRQRIATQ